MSGMNYPQKSGSHGHRTARHSAWFGVMGFAPASWSAAANGVRRRFRLADVRRKGSKTFAAVFGVQKRCHDHRSPGRFALFRESWHSRQRRGVRRQTKCDAAFAGSRDKEKGQNVRSGDWSLKSGVTATAVQDDRRFQWPCQSGWHFLIFLSCQNNPFLGRTHPSTNSRNKEPTSSPRGLTRRHITFAARSGWRCCIAAYCGWRAILAGSWRLGRCSRIITTLSPIRRYTCPTLPVCASCFHCCTRRPQNGPIVLIAHRDGRFGLITGKRGLPTRSPISHG